MNIVYLIGNGFDVNLGMNTRYQDFYKYYTKLPNSEDSDVIAQFKKDLNANLENWSDLEFALGHYLVNLNAEQAIELHRHLIKHLSEYIKLEEDKYPFDKDQASVFATYIIKPQSKLTQKEVTEIENYRSRWKNINWDLKIITFNYSRSVERLIKNTGKIGVHDSARLNIDYTALEHIHGFTDQRMILGVNDASQINNKELRAQKRVLDRYVKSNCNAATRQDHDAKCLQWISKANLICAFGLSFGDTDKKWWETVGNTLKGDCRMILFEYNPNKKFNLNEHVDQLEEEEMVKERFLAKTNIEKDLWAKVNKNIYVAYNTKMFKMDIGKKAEMIRTAHPALA